MSIIKHTKRNSCRLCESKKINLVLELKSIPIGEKYTDVPQNKEERFPIDIYACEECHCVQTQDDIESNYLWENYTYFSSQTKGIERHFEKFVNALEFKGRLKGNETVFDIGSNDGTLLKYFKQKGCSVYGIDPSQVVVQKAMDIGIASYKGLFTEDIIEKFPEEYREVDIITAFNVFAHSPDMGEMIKGVKKMLKPEGVFCFEVQYLQDIVDKKLLGTIFHEHMIHYSVTSAKNFLCKNHLKIIDLERNNIQFGSIIFYCTHKDNPIKEINEINELIEEEKCNSLLDKTWGKAFDRYINEGRSKISKLKKDWEIAGKIVVGYGAARSGPTLLINYGLNNCVKYILDDHKAKCGKYGVFESLLVRKTELINLERIDVLIILAWIHTEKILKACKEFLERNGEILILWPKVEVINKDNYNDWINSDKRLK